MEEAVKEGVTRGTGQGNGLFGSIRIAAESGGAFSINSGNAYLMLARDRRTQIRDETTSWFGTSVDCSINYGRALVLERALRFGDQPYTPVDVVDAQYENEEEGVLKYILKDEVPSIGSRYAGFEARRKLVNLVQMIQPNRLIIDCRGLGLISSSFADEFFAKLISAPEIGISGPEPLFQGLETTNIRIIERSVKQRCGKSFIDILEKQAERQTELC